MMCFVSASFLFVMSLFLKGYYGVGIGYGVSGICLALYSRRKARQQLRITEDTQEDSDKTSEYSCNCHITHNATRGGREINSDGTKIAKDKKSDVHDKSKPTKIEDDKPNVWGGTHP